MVPPVVKLYENADFLFQQDLAPAHSDNYYKSQVITVVDSPDLTHRESIEYRQEENEKNTDELKAAIKASFNNTLAGLKGMQCVCLFKVNC